MPRGMQKKQKEEKKDDGRNENGRPVRQPVSQIRKYIHSDCITDRVVREGVFMIIADKSAPESMVLVPMDDYEDGVVAKTKLMIVTDLVEHMDCDECSYMITLKRVLGLGGR